MVMKRRRLRKACEDKAAFHVASDEDVALSDDDSQQDSVLLKRRRLTKADAPCGGTVLDTRYEDHKTVGQLGAKYNPVRKKWVVPKDHPNVELFEEWIRTGTSAERGVSASPSFVLSNLSDL